MWRQTSPLWKNQSSKKKTWNLVCMRKGFLGGANGKETACQSRRCGFSPWVGKIPCRREGQPTPVFLPGESHGQRSLAGYSPWGHKELDTTEHTRLYCCIRHRCRNRAAGDQNVTFNVKPRTGSWTRKKIYGKSDEIQKVCVLVHCSILWSISAFYLCPVVT